jgi:hypothetical protein
MVVMGARNGATPGCTRPKWRRAPQIWGVLALIQEVKWRICVGESSALRSPSSYDGETIANRWEL